MEKEKFYIQCLSPNGTITIINALSIESLKEYLPTYAFLRQHLLIEGVAMVKAQKEGKDFTPEPLYLAAPKDLFQKIIKEIKIRCKWVNENHIALFTNPDQIIPICIIKPE